MNNVGNSIREQTLESVKITFQQPTHKTMSEKLTREYKLKACLCPSGIKRVLEQRPEH